jgi:VWFA-related protein
MIGRSMAGTCWRTALVALIAASAAGVNGLARPRTQPPQFKSGVEMLAVDVQVVGRDGEPVLGLTPDQFTVKIDGRARPVRSVQFLEQTSRSRFIEARPNPGERETAGVAATGVGRAPDGRIFVLAVDENSFQPGHARSANEAARLFIDRLAAEDYVGLATLPGSQPWIAPTREHHLVRTALGRIAGLKSRPPGGVLNIGASEVFDITAGDTDTLERVFARECLPADRTCRKRVQMDAMLLAQEMAIRTTQSITALRGLLDALGAVDGRKIVVLVSAGMAASHRIGSGSDLSSQAQEVGRQAAAANTTLYVLHMDTSFLEAFSPNAPKFLPSHMRDTATFTAGLGLIAGAAGGEMFRVVTDADPVFDRVLRETSAYYLLGIEPLATDRDGKPHRITVNVGKRGVTVRSRSTIVVPVH